MKLILSHPTGNANVRAACQGFFDANILAQFNTTVVAFQGDFLDRMSKIGLLGEIKRRRLETSLQPLTSSWPWREIGRLTALKVGLSSLVKHETGPFSIDAVYQSFDRHVASKLNGALKLGVDAVYSYEDGALFTFQQARQLDLSCFYDLPIGYWRTARRLLEVERERWPEWASTLTGFNDSSVKLARKDEELRLANHIIVASQFTAKTLADFPGTIGPVHIVPYGFPPVASARTYSTHIGKRPLKLLFVGGLSQRKGIANLFAAVEQLGNHVEITVVGQKASTTCSPLNAALTKHRWVPSLPHNKVLQLMQEHDVLVFPSLFEGFGLVITEAMSQGMPVITTDRTAGPDLINHDENGWLIKAGSTEDLVKTIEKLCNYPELIRKAGELAMETARRRPWSVYEQELVEVIVGAKTSY